jgi:tRNA(adenine34) deaminase
MEQALSQAEIGRAKGLAPFGAVIVGPDGELIAEGYNQVAQDFDVSAHGEIMAIRHAEAKLKRIKLQGYTIYTTCEPCLMCTYAITRAGISRVVYATRGTDVPDRKVLLDMGLPEVAGWINRQSDWPRLEITEGVLRERCLKLFENYAWT